MLRLFLPPVQRLADTDVAEGTGAIRCHGSSEHGGGGGRNEESGGDAEREAAVGG
jgi:hypothetical protein